MVKPCLLINVVVLFHCFLMSVNSQPFIMDVRPVPISMTDVSTSLAPNVTKPTWLNGIEYIAF